MREYKIVYEYPKRNHIIMCEQRIVSAESKEDAIYIGKPPSAKLVSARLMPLKKVKKPFDITQHEWSDVIAGIEPKSGHTLVIKSHGSWLSFDKDDVIAMARDRGVTVEDLK